MTRADAKRQGYLKELRKAETPDTKLCTKCERILPLGSFWKSSNKEARKGRATFCTECSKVYNAERYEDNGRNARLERLYGMTLEQYDGMLEAQNNRCAICGSEDPKRGSRFLVDHCHRTGDVRGLLCHHCNVFIGMAEDDTATLLSAVKYLEESR